MTNVKKFVYSFKEGASYFKDKDKNLKKDILGGKGGNLAEMAGMNIPIPPGFTITTEVCEYLSKNGEYPSGLNEEIDEELEILEKDTGKVFGNKDNPLLVSVRSGAKISMPGMMDTILNLGLNDEITEAIAKKTCNKRFAFDIHRRLIQMFGEVVMGIEHNYFEKEIQKIKDEKGISLDEDLDDVDMGKLVDLNKSVFKHHTGEVFPSDPREQLKRAVRAVFGSWNTPRAIKYREINNIKNLKGTACNIQTMVFGNMSKNNSGTGVVFTRNGISGENKPEGSFLLSAQGEDVVSGTRDALPIESLGDVMGDLYDELLKIMKDLELHFHDMQDIEFTIEEGKLFILQTRDGKRTLLSALKIAREMVEAKLISKEEALSKIDPEKLLHLLHKQVDEKADKKVIAKGLGASPGGACGKAVFTADDAEEWHNKGEKVILVRSETVTDDIHGMVSSEGILTSRGGLGAHAALISRDQGIPCVVGCTAIKINEDCNSSSIKGFDGETYVLNKGDFVTIDGGSGEVMIGKVELIEPEFPDDFYEIMRWADEIAKMKVRVNTDTAFSCKKALDLGAVGVGLCRTEHMLLDASKLQVFRRVILEEHDDNREKAIEEFMNLQKEDLSEIFKVMTGLPVTIRLLDPPLHEFLPKEEDKISELAKEMNIDENQLKYKIESLSEANPMLGHRGCRLGITNPEIYESQVKAIIEAAIIAKKGGFEPIPEIEVPLVSNLNEFITIKEMIDKCIASYGDKVNFEYKIGTMIELPRACFIADQISPLVDFISFGTNDLTQTTYGISRDDFGRFGQDYLEKEIFESDPFAVIDRGGVGELMKIAVKKALSTNENLEIGICGEHGGNPDSIQFCNEIGLDYVSLSPYRIPVARLAVAQANLV